MRLPLWLAWASVLSIPSRSVKCPKADVPAYWLLARCSLQHAARAALQRHVLRRDADPPGAGAHGCAWGEQQAQALLNSVVSPAAGYSLHSAASAAQKCITLEALRSQPPRPNAQLHNTSRTGRKTCGARAGRVSVCAALPLAPCSVAHAGCLPARPLCSWPLPGQLQAGLQDKRHNYHLRRLHAKQVGGLLLAHHAGSDSCCRPVYHAQRTQRVSLALTLTCIPRNQAWPPWHVS